MTDQSDSKLKGIAHKRPISVNEKENFSSGGRRWMLILRGKWGLKVDKVLLWLTGYSLMTAQYCLAMGEQYSPTLMLKTIGAKSHELRSACLPYFKVDGKVILRGSNGGGAFDPGWVHNIRANSNVWVRIDRKTRPMYAYVANGQEREEIYEKLCEISSTTKRYQEMCAPRELPLVVIQDWAELDS